MISPLSAAWIFWNLDCFTIWIFHLSLFNRLPFLHQDFPLKPQLIFFFSAVTAIMRQIFLLLWGCFSIANMKTIFCCLMIMVISFLIMMIIFLIIMISLLITMVSCSYYDDRLWWVCWAEYDEFPDYVDLFLWFYRSWCCVFHMMMTLLISFSYDDDDDDLADFFHIYIWWLCWLWWWCEGLGKMLTAQLAKKARVRGGTTTHPHDDDGGHDGHDDVYGDDGNYYDPWFHATLPYS